MEVKNTITQMRRGILEFCILSMLEGREIYTAELINNLKTIRSLTKNIKMEELNKKISVSTSLNGKDLWLIESFIKNKHTSKNLNLTFINDINKCDVLISKEYENGKYRYFAVLRKSNATLPILPYLNPMTLKKLFLYLGSPTSIERYKLNTSYKDISNYQVYKFIDSLTTKVMRITHPEFSLLLSNKENLLYSSIPINKNLLLKLKNTSIEELKVDHLEKNTTLDSKYNMNLDLFKWNMGLLLHEDFFDKNNLTKNLLFKQIDWPDYGKFPYPKEFIELSALLDKNAFHYSGLVRQSQFQPNIINRYLNALYITKSIVLVYQEQDEMGDSQIVTHRKSKFLNSLRTFLNKIHF